MSITWPKELVDEIGRRRSVIFLSAGISMQAQNATGAKPPSWTGLLNAAVALVPGPSARKTEIRKLINQNDLLTACDVIKSLMGNHSFFSFMTDQLHTPNFQPAPIHDSLVQLGSRIYATPNVDKIFDSKVLALPHTAVKIKHYYDSDIGGIGKGPLTFVLKVHRTIDVPDTMIFTRKDYTTARIEHRHFYQIFEALAITHTFLFLGCGFNDPDIRLILEDQALAFSAASPHYFVSRKGSFPSTVRQSVERNLNLNILEYAGGFDALKPEIDNLVTEVNRARAEMQVNRSW